jgi:hypothetical protein
MTVKGDTVMKKISNRSLTLAAETLRPLVDLRRVAGAKAHSADPCWTTRYSKGLPCTDEPTSTNTCPPPPTWTK